MPPELTPNTCFAAKAKDFLDLFTHIRILIISCSEEGLVMPNKTIYIRESDQELWGRAERLADGNVSALLTEALRRYVDEEERMERGRMETIEVQLPGPHGPSYSAEFVGEWLVRPDESSTRTLYPGYDPGAYYGVALTRKGKIAVYVQHVDERFEPMFDIYDSLEAAEKSTVPLDIVTLAAVALGSEYDGYVRKLDI